MTLWNLVAPGYGPIPLNEGVGAYVFVNAEAAALVARFTTPPTNARKLLIDSTYTAIKASADALSGYNKLDCLWLMAAHTEQAGQRNWKADLYNLTPLSSPGFTVDRGYVGNGSGYLDTGFNPTTAAGNYSLNSASALLYSRTTGVGPIADLAASDGFLTLATRATGDLFTGRVNRAANGTAANADGSQYYSVIRTGSTAWKARKNGADLVSVGGATSVAVPNVNITLLRNSAAFSSRGLAMAGLGGGLTDAEDTALRLALLPYLQGVGASVGE